MVFHIFSSAPRRYYIRRRQRNEVKNKLTDPAPFHPFLHITTIPTYLPIILYERITHYRAVNYTGWAKIQYNNMALCWNKNNNKK